MPKMNCPDCGADLYWSGHDDYECPGAGEGCQECGWGCDLDFVEDGHCAGLRASEGDDEPAEETDPPGTTYVNGARVVPGSELSKLLAAAERSA